MHLLSEGASIISQMYEYETRLFELRTEESNWVSHVGLEAA